MAGSPPELWGYVAAAIASMHPLHGSVTDEAITAPGVETVAAVNEYVNRNIRYVPDIEDNWQLPGVTLERGAGDCEDMALLKLALLAGIGEPGWLLLVHDKSTRRAHAVALTENYVLDVYTYRPLPIDTPMEYRPVMVMTMGQAWIYGRIS